MRRGQRPHLLNSAGVNFVTDQGRAGYVSEMFGTVLTKSLVSIFASFWSIFGYNSNKYKYSVEDETSNLEDEYSI